MTRKSCLKVRLSGVPTRLLGRLLGRLLAGIMLLATPAVPVVAAGDAEQTAAVASSPALYRVAMPWDKYLSGTKVQRKSWLKNAGREVPSDLVDRFRQAGDGLQLLVITADWCGDSVHSVPYIATLASRAGVELRVVDFKAGKAIMEAHPTPDGRASTPTVVLLRDDQEVAVWVERPASLQTWFLGAADQLSDEEQMERKMSWYDWNRGSDALGEIVALAEQTARKD